MSPTAAENVETSELMNAPGETAPKRSETGTDSLPKTAAAAVPLTVVEGGKDKAAAAADEAEAREEYERPFLQTLDALVSDKLSAAANKSMSTGQPTVLARLVNLSRKLSELEDARGLYQQATIAARLLKASDANAQTVNDIIDDIDFSTSKNSPIYSVMRGLAKSVGYQFILLIVFLVASSTPSIYLAATRPEATPVVLDEAWRNSMSLLAHPFVIAIIFGVFGSVVSILLRLSEFEVATRKSRQFLMMTGAMLPLVGALFGAVTCALFASGIVNFQFANPGAAVTGIGNPYFYIVIGFLSGFSERFTRGLLGRAENGITGTTETPPAGANGKPAAAK